MKRLILKSFFLASQEIKDVVVVARDTDVLVSFVWAHYNIKRNWFFEYNAEKYANIRKICNHWGKDDCEAILPFQTITGSDTTSY